MNDEAMMEKVKSVLSEKFELEQLYMSKLLASFAVFALSRLG